MGVSHPVHVLVCAGGRGLRRGEAPGGAGEAPRGGAGTLAVPLTHQLLRAPLQVYIYVEGSRFNFI